MKRTMAEFAALESTSPEEEDVMKDLEREFRKANQSWEYLCGMAEGVNVVTRMHPYAHRDITFRCIVRVVIIVTARMALEKIQEAEDADSFPEELDNE